MQRQHLFLAATSLFGLLSGALLAAGCDGLSGRYRRIPGVPADALVASGAGVGDACDETLPCRGGLVCNDDGVCEPGMSLESGDACVIGPECREGLACNTPCPQLTNPAQLCCGAVGDGVLGDPCQSDLDCGAGLRCGIVGFAAECVTAGTGDFGDACEISADCYQGLFCADGACALPVPPLGVPLWKGVSCPGSSDDGVTALFNVPGAAATPESADFFSLPFPNDIRLDGDRPNLDGFPTPGPGVIGKDIVARYVDAVEERSTYWSNNPSVVMRFSGHIDFDTLHVEGQPRRVVLVDLDDPSDSTESIGLSRLASTGRTNYVCHDWLAVRPALGGTMTPGHTYAVWVTTEVKTSSGGNIARSAQFDAVMGNSAPSDAALAAAHAAYAPFRQYLTAKGIAPSTILNAAVFTVGDPLAEVRELARVVASEPVPTASDWVKCGGGAVSPCPQRDGERACGNGTAQYDEYQALLELPIFQEGDAPYWEEGGGLSTDVVRTEEVCLSIAVPKTTMPAAGWPLVVFGHGTGGSYRAHLRPEIAGRLAGGTPAFAVVGIDQVQHGPRRGDSEEDPDTLFFNFQNPDAARGNPIQGALDQLSLIEWAKALDVTVAGTRLAVDPAHILLLGHSQGATHGSISLPFSDLVGGVLSGNGGSLVHALLGKTNPVNIAGGIPLVIQDVDGEGKLAMRDKHPVLGLLQHYIDPADPVNFAPLVTERPEGSSGRKHLLQTFGLDDTYSPPETLTSYLRAANLTLVENPTGFVPSGVNDTGVGPTSGPVSGNRGTDPDFVTAVARQYAPDSDGHFVIYENDDANADVLGFLRALGSDQPPAVPAP